MPGSKKSHEYDLVRACLKRKRDSHKHLYEYLSPRLFPICLRYGSNHEEAKDFLQESFIKIFGNLKNFGFSGSFEGWSKRVTVNQCIELIRKKGKNFFTLELDDEVDFGHDPKALDNLEASDILSVISEMPTGYRTVFNMYVIEGFSHKEIAGQLNITESTSKTQLMKARKYLQQRIKDRH